VEVSVRSIAVFRVTVEPLEDACVMRATGELDSSTADRLRLPLAAARQEGVTTLLDLGGVSFIDSTGLRVLLEAARESNAQEWAWFIVRPSDAVLHVLGLTGAAPQLPIVAPQRGTARRPQARVVPLHRPEPRRARRIGTR
jgi:anti-sigma B factor antagonist